MSIYCKFHRQIVTIIYCKLQREIVMSMNCKPLKQEFRITMSTLSLILPEFFRLLVVGIYMMEILMKWGRV